MIIAGIGRRDLLAGAGASLALAACQSSGSSRPPTVSLMPTTEIAGARWFTGEGFEARTGWIRDGRFTFSRPADVQSSLDLAGTWIVPPFADAHSHSFGLGMPGTDIENARRYLADGVFYIQSQGNLPLTDEEKAAFGANTPAGPDVSFSNGTLTGPNDPLVAGFALILLPQGAFQGYTIETLQNVRYFTLSSPEDVDAAWATIRAQGSDFLKAYLFNIDGEALPPVLPAEMLGRTALAPEVFERIVERAQTDGLRVSAHVTTAGDFRFAVSRGADEIAHVPSIGALTVEDAQDCARRGVPVVATLSAAATQATLVPSELRSAFEGLVAAGLRNLETLRENGATILIGSDEPGDTTRREADYLRAQGGWDNAELLRVWGATTPRAIFPERDIGELSEGFEASFLALGGDPLADWSATARILVRVKQGQAIDSRGRPDASLI